MKKNEVDGNIFNKKNCNYLKAVAIIMMITHHLYGFPDWIKINNPYYELTIHNIPIWFSIGKFCKICVSVFAFISGFGIYISFKKKRNIKYVLKKIIKLIVIYEISFVCFVLPIILFFKNVTMSEVKDNFLLLSSSIVYTNWYISFYIEAILMILFYHIIPIKKNLFTDNIICFIIPIMLNIIIPNNTFGHYFPIFMLGYLFSKYNIFGIFENKIIRVKMRIFITLLLLFFSILIKFFYGEFFLNISTITFITPSFCYLLAYVVNWVSEFKTINKIFLFLSKYSAWYWFVHVIFHSNIVLLQEIVYFPKIPILIIIWTFLVLAPVVILLKRIYEMAYYMFNNLKYFV